MNREFLATCRSGKAFGGSVILALGLCSGHATAVESLTLGFDQQVSGSVPALSPRTPWVTATFTDLAFYSDANSQSAMAGAKNAVQLDLSIADARRPESGPAVLPEYLAPLGLGAFPDFGVIQGHGNLRYGDVVDAIYLNFNPAKPLDFLRLSSFDPLSTANFSARPNGVFLSKDGFAVPNAPEAGLFDIKIRYDGTPFGLPVDFASRLVLYLEPPFGPYGATENLDPSDFNLRSSGSPTGGYVAVASLSSVYATRYDPAIIAAVPEPSTYAMLGVGLAALGLVARRRKARS